jgi:hypothetical protein
MMNLRKLHSQTLRSIPTLESFHGLETINFGGFCGHESEARCTAVEKRTIADTDRVSHRSIRRLTSAPRSPGAGGVQKAGQNEARLLSNWQRLTSSGQTIGRCERHAVSCSGQEKQNRNLFSIGLGMQYFTSLSSAFTCATFVTKALLPGGKDQVENTVYLSRENQLMIHLFGGSPV